MTRNKEPTLGITVVRYHTEADATQKEAFQKELAYLQGIRSN